MNITVLITIDQQNHQILFNTKIYPSDNFYFFELWVLFLTLGQGGD